MRKTIIAATVILALALSGCALFRQLQADPKAQYMIAQKLFDDAIVVLIKFRGEGKFSQQEADQISIAIKKGNDLLDQWQDALYHPSATEPSTPQWLANVAGQVDAIMQELQAIAVKYGVDIRKGK